MAKSKDEIQAAQAEMRRKLDEAANTLWECRELAAKDAYSFSDTFWNKLCKVERKVWDLSVKRNMEAL